MARRVRTENKFARVRKAAERAGFKNLGHAAAVVRKVAAGSIRVGKRPAPAGGPPHTRKGALKKAVLFAADGWDRYVVGPSADLVGPVGAAHEQGGPFRRQTYERRPFMRPAVERVAPQIPGIWRDTIRE